MFKIKNIFLVIFCTFASVYCVSPTVKTDKGSLVGTTYTLQNGRVVYAFYGIPYAAPPTGINRFQAPKPTTRWFGTYNATYNRNVCLQLYHVHMPNISEILGNEDCLYLNVFTPKLPNKSDLMNVLVHIHGGAFMFGNGITTYPEYLMQSDDVVFVTMNYRLGVLGFFSGNNQQAPGNYGLKDQVAALRWVNRNIRNFGGNPNKVTLFGNSAGGASVHYHFISPLSEGLFQKGISSSGSTLTPWAHPRNITEKSIRLASLLGCPNTRGYWFMMKCLRKKPAMEIVEATRHFLMWKNCPFTPFGPVTEPFSPNAFLTEDPSELLKKKKVKNLPWMVGVVEKEGLYPGAGIISQEIYLKELNNRWNEIAPNLLMYNFSVSVSEKDQVSAAVKHFYFSNNSISSETTENLIQVLGDRLYYNGITNSVKLHNAATSNNVYCYNFVYKEMNSPYAEVFMNNSKIDGAGHGDDQFFILGSSTLPKKIGRDADMAKFMTSSVIAFMNDGNPNTGVVDWQPVSDNNVTCLGIYSSNVLKMESIIWSKKRSQFWKKLLPSEYSESNIK